MGGYTPDRQRHFGLSAEVLWQMQGLLQGQSCSSPQAGDDHLSSDTEVVQLDAVQEKSTGAGYYCGTWQEQSR